MTGGNSGGKGGNSGKGSKSRDKSPVRKRKSSRANSSKKRARSAASGGSGRSSGKIRTPCPHPAGSPQHKAQRWDDYQTNGGQKDYPDWSKRYDVAVVQASRSNAAVKAYRDKHHPGYELEVTVVTASGLARRIDIADKKVNPTEGIEHKMCSYTSRNAKILSEVQRDAELVEADVEITWVFESPDGNTKISQPLLDELAASGIDVIIDGEPYIP